MSRHQWILGNAPVVVDQMGVAVADAAMTDLNFYIPGIQVAGGVIEFFKRRLGLLCSIAIDLHTSDLLQLD